MSEVELYPTEFKKSQENSSSCVRVFIKRPSRRFRRPNATGNFRRNFQSIRSYLKSVVMWSKYSR